MKIETNPTVVREVSWDVGNAGSSPCIIHIPGDYPQGAIETDSPWPSEPFIIYTKSNNRNRRNQVKPIPK